MSPGLLGSPLLFERAAGTIPSHKFPSQYLKAPQSIPAHPPASRGTSVPLLPPPAKTFSCNLQLLAFPQPILLPAPLQRTVPPKSHPPISSPLESAPIGRPSHASSASG